MKNLILCSFLILFVGFTYSQESVKLKRIGLEIMKEDLGKMNWEDAKKACTDLGDGWRLPTKDELNILYKNKDKIGGFTTSAYWSSTECEYGGEYGKDNCVWFQAFYGGVQHFSVKHITQYVRSVRDLK